jgi:hypothetical protein
LGLLAVAPDRISLPLLAAVESEQRRQGLSGQFGPCWFRR